jgi:two-component system, OmpR family, response regulator
VRSCASGADALATTADWTPDLVLLDVIMPEMDGPTTFGRLRARSRTANIPVVFMTARAQASEHDRLLALGAAGVIAKPFDPMTLAALVRRYAPAGETPSPPCATGSSPACADAAMLAQLRCALAENSSASPNSRGTRQRAVLDQIETIAHDLAETAGIYGFHYISLDASAIEDAVLAETDPTRPLDNFLASIKSEID